MNWKHLKDKPEDDKHYLISCLQADGTYSAPHRAYYVHDEDRFYSLEHYSSHPLVADIYIEIPEVPKI